MNFVESYKNGMVKVSDITTYIKEWKDDNESKSLHEFLGLSEEEYRNWQILGNNFLLKRLNSTKGFKGWEGN